MKSSDKRFKGFRALCPKRFLRKLCYGYYVFIMLILILQVGSLYDFMDSLRVINLNRISTYHIGIRHELR